MDFHGVAFMLSRASFSSTFPKDCGRGEGLWATTCLKTVVRGKCGHASCNILFSIEPLFLCQSNVMEMIRLTEMRLNLATFNVGDSTRFKTVLSVCLFCTYSHVSGSTESVFL